MTTSPQVAIIDFGSQHTLEIQRTCRELGHLSDVLKPEEFERMYMSDARKYMAAIGSGGHRSIYEEGSPKLHPFLLPFQNDNPLPYLGICYGMHASIHQMGGVVVRGRPEYASTKIELFDSPLFESITNRQQEVWMSHADEVKEIPEDFEIIARSEQGGIAAVQNRRFAHYCVQFHPEVSNTKSGAVMIANFLRQTGCTQNYVAEDLPEIIRASIREEVKGRRAIIGYSGGVDSSVVTELAESELGDDLLAILIDGGHMREGEVDEVRNVAAQLGVNLKVVEAQDRFFNIMGNAKPEEIRDKFSATYSAIFQEEALAWDDGRGVVIIQGTIAPDRIESGTTGGAKIKRHHNLGLTFGNLPQMHPLGSLFKDEVRNLGRMLDLPESVWNRMPFPGPGNFLRGVRDRESAEVVSWAEARVRELCKADPDYADINQLVVGALRRAPGVKGDSPVYGYMIGIRAVRTTRYMTVEGVKFSPEMQEKIDKTLTHGHQLITFTAFIPTPKPPGMVEWM